jgi:hypothetical protein
MPTVLEEYTTNERRFVVRFLWIKGFDAKDIHKEMFPIYVGKCLSRKAVHNCVALEVPKLLSKQSKRFLCCGFRRTGKAMGQVYQC